MNPTWKVSVCCNYPENGFFAERLSAVDISCGDYEMTLTASGAEPYFAWHFGDAYKMQVGRRRFRCFGHHEWYGNWCWDLTRMKKRNVRELVFHLIRCGFTIEHGSELLWNWFKRMERQHQAVDTET